LTGLYYVHKFAELAAVTVIKQAALSSSKKYFGEEAWDSC
jgi:hypothetical protein